MLKDHGKEACPKQDEHTHSYEFLFIPFETMSSGISLNRGNVSL